MPYKFNIVSSMASFDAIDADRIAVGRVARLAPIKIVHGERRVTRDLVQTLPVDNRLLHSVLITKNLVTPNNRLHSTRQTQSTEAIIKDLIIFEGGGRVVRNLNTRRKAIKNTIPPQNRVALRRNQHTGLRIAKDVVLLEDTFAPIEDTNTTIATVEDLITLERWIRVCLDPHTGHRVVKDLVLLEQT